MQDSAPLRMIGAPEKHLDTSRALFLRAMKDIALEWNIILTGCSLVTFKCVLFGVCAI